MDPIWIKREQSKPIKNIKEETEGRQARLSRSLRGFVYLVIAYIRTPSLFLQGMSKRVQATYFFACPSQPMQYRSVGWCVWVRYVLELSATVRTSMQTLRSGGWISRPSPWP